MSCCEPTLGPASTLGPVLNEMLSVANIAALAPLTYGDGTGIYVRSVRDYFVYRAGSSTAVDGITVVAHSTGTGRWERLNTPHPSWALQPTWEINSASSPENDGATSGTTIPFAEFLRRRAGQGCTFRCPSSQTVNIRADMPTSDPLMVDVIVDPGVSFIVQGVPTVAFSGTVGSKVDLSITAPGTSSKVTSTWTAANEVNRLVRDITNNRWAWVARDMGVGTNGVDRQAKLSPWIAINETVSALAYGGVVATTNGAQIETYTLPKVARANITSRGGIGGSSPVLFQKLDFTASGAIGLFTALNNQLMFQNCDFSGNNRQGAGSIWWHNCRNNVAAPDFVYAGFITINGGLNTITWSNTSKAAGCTVELGGNVLFQGTQIIALRGGVIRVRNVFFEDVTSAGNGACIVAQGSFLQAGSAVVCGTGNTVPSVALSARSGLSISTTWASSFRLTTTSSDLVISEAGSVRTTARAIDPATGLPGTARTMSWANLDATYAAGGFEGAVSDLSSGCWAGKT